ncbi:TIGR00730 family Rossman fold protein [Pseudorhodobacter sp. W20_MBD10_FR17]|uniref:LOG family protein n=1 Tax=Pseudorhodobacter sp. W20_MBD10_FR17 TaxID=3240266 RepID=UPI003F9B75B2
MSSSASICIFCGARAGKLPVYGQAAAETGQMIADMGWRLVYGAGDIGLMGEVARAAQAAGAETLGVMPTHLVRQEVAKCDLGQLILTETMHERKKVMFMNCDAIVVLPGGGGSLDEFFEVLTWRQLGLHAKPIILLDVAGYWQPLVALLDHVVTEGFADGSMRGFVQVVPDVAALKVALTDGLK